MAGRNAGRWLVVLGCVAAMPVVASAQESPATVEGLAAEVEQRVVSPGGAMAVTTRTLLLVEGSARVESLGEPPRAGYAEYQLHDFVRGRVYRVLPNDQIYFEGAWSRGAASQGFLEGWAPRPADLAVRMISLKADELDGVPATLELMEYRFGAGAPAYAFVWSSVPPGRLPLRVAYTQRGGQTVILSYRSVELRAVDPSSLSVPEGFVNLSPF